MRILFTGGGTLGSVTPQLAVYEELHARFSLQRQSVSALWIGTKAGPEQTIVHTYQIPFVSIASGKLRRYRSIRNFFDPFLVCVGILQAAWHIWRFAPDVIMHAAGYVGVPVLVAGYLLGKKSITLQLDCEPSLSNLIGARFSSTVGVATEEQKKYFSSKKTELVGIPTRIPATPAKYQALEDLSRDIKKRLRISDDEKVVLITGGGTGATSLNDSVQECVRSLVQYAHIIHITGKGKKGNSDTLARAYPRYHPFEFPLDEMIAFEAIADVVVTRAGMGTLAELSALAKPTIIIPLPNSHQEKNARYFHSLHAALVLSHASLTPEMFEKTVRDLLLDTHEQSVLSQNMKVALPRDAAKKVADMICRLI